MNNIRLKNISIRNFKGIKEFDFPLNGTHTAIHGTNATGKTTIFDAISWLLFDKDSLNSAVFDLKPLDKTGKAINNLETEVEAVFIDDLNETSLKKVYVEKWTKKRGSASKEFTGHTTNHFINGVPAKAKEYKQAVADICPDGVFLLLTNPRYFNTVMSWQDRRKILLDICGDITDDDVINSDPDLAVLNDILGKHSIDDYRKIVKSRLPEINREIEDIPVRISEVERSMGEDLRSVKTVKSVIAVATGNRKDLSEKLSQIENGGEIATARKELAEIESKILQIDNKTEKARQEKQKAWTEEQSELSRAIANCSTMLGEQQAKQERLDKTANETWTEIEKTRVKMERLREDWHKENDTPFEFDQSGTCPTCGQTIPAEQLEKTRKTALEVFNADKARRLKQINKQGLEEKTTLTILKNDLKKIEGRKTELDAKIKEAEAKLAQAKQKLDEFNRQPKEPGQAPPEKIKLLEAKEKIETKISDLEDGAEGDAAKVRDEINAYDTQLEELNAELAQIESQAKAKERIKELSSEEKKLAAEYEKLEWHLFLTEKFIKAKVGMLTDQINGKFAMASFKLFQDQINGGLRECCVATYEGVPYESLNNGARINLGLDIINVLSAHHGITLPIFVDNAESVVDLMPTTAQQIRLIVSPKDKQLRIEGGE